MKSILLSIKPEWVAKILNGEKTIEIRKKFPKDYVGWVYIYCTKGKPKLTKIPELDLANGKVVARFWCDNVDKLEVEFYKNEPLYDENSCYQAIKKVCLEQLEYVDFNEDECDRQILYTNEIFEHEEKNNRFLKSTCLTGKQLQNYFNGCDTGCAIHISKLEVFDRPKELSDMWAWTREGTSWTLSKAPQNYCYIEGGK